MITISLKNPPYKGIYWRLVLWNEVWGDNVWLGVHIPVDQPMTLESLPAGFTYPLYIDLFVYELNVSPYNIVYEIQSCYGWDWPHYKPIFINEPGKYEYDVATEQLTLIEAGMIGTITDGELDYQNVWQRFPLLDIPLNTRTRVRITGRNDTEETQRMGIHWFVADPDGLLVQEYSVWEAWPYTGAGAEHQFIGSSFDLSKVGQYTMQWILLLMNPDDPEVVDRYIGNLCTVKSALVPTFSELAASFSKV